MPVWAVALAAGAVLVLAAGLLYNRLVRLRNRTQAAWSDIDVYLRRRHDLVPNLVETVRAYAAHERGVLDAVTRARTAAVAAEQRGRPGEVAGSEQALEASLERLFAVAEAYPDLEASARFGDLQRELAATENKIAFSRQLYNDTVTAFQTATQSFPGVLLAGPLGFEAPELYAAQAGERAASQVRFGDRD